MTRPARVSGRDIGRYLWLQATGILIRMTGPGAQPGVAGAIAALPSLVGRRGKLARIKTLFPDGFSAGPDPSTIPRRVYAARQEEAMMICRLARQPGWRPPLAIEGLEEVRAALETGGVMLWCCPQRFNMLLTSLAVHDAGLDPIRLSHWAHGPAASDTPSEFAQSRINAPWQAVENRYATRLEIGPDGVRRPMAAFARYLGEGRLVIVNAIPMSKGPTACPVPHGEMLLATGATRTALRAGAAIVAVALRRDPDGRFGLRFIPLAEPGEAPGLDELTRRMALLSHAAIAQAPDLWILGSPQLGPAGSDMAGL